MKLMIIVYYTYKALPRTSILSSNIRVRFVHSIHSPQPVSLAKASCTIRDIVHHMAMPFGEVYPSPRVRHRAGRWAVALMISDGSGLPISHTGSTSLTTPSHSFTLSNVLCVPTMKCNLISVSQFCKSINTSIEFLPSSFHVKDLHTGAILGYLGIFWSLVNLVWCIMIKSNDQIYEMNMSYNE